MDSSDYSEGVTFSTKFWLLLRGWFWLPLLLVICFGVLGGVHSYMLWETDRWETESRSLAETWIVLAYNGGTILSERNVRSAIFRYSAKIDDGTIVVFECNPRVPYCEPAGIDLRVSP